MNWKLALENQNVAETRCRKLGILATKDPCELKHDIPNFLSMGLSSFPPMISMVQSFHASQVVYDFQASKSQIHPNSPGRDDATPSSSMAVAGRNSRWMKVFFWANSVTSNWHVKWQFSWWTFGEGFCWIWTSSQVIQLRWPRSTRRTGVTSNTGTVSFSHSLYTHALSHSWLVKCCFQRCFSL